MLRIVALVALILAIFAVSGCISGTGGTGGTTDQTVTEVQRWHDSIAFWRSQVASLQIQVSTMPEGDRRDSVLKALETAKWWLALFEGATNLATTQPVPVVAKAK
jgi:hypothetical protein